ncbi:MAG: DNA internalization-related competence protein ComEC/Rec2 [Ruminococcaceae bacterium]|nr:DNA internalization-related competence protein ComEC/Rec2 [Oscillospiraceae bacterium]
MRRLATFCFAFAFGIFAAQYLLPARLLLPAAAGCAALGALWALALHENMRRRALLIALGLTLALCWDRAYVRLAWEPFEALAGTRQTLTLELTDYPSETEKGSRAEVRVLDRRLYGKAILYGGEELATLEPGERVTLPVDVHSAVFIRSSEVPTHTARGVYALLYARGKAELSTGNAGTLRYLPQRLARALELSVDQSFPERTAPFMKAILLGDRYELTTADGANLSEAGLYHVTAVSGLHCAFLLAILSFLIGKHRRRLLSAAAIPVLILYAMTVGLTPSVVRSCVMLILLLVAPLFGRESDGPTSLSLALFLLLAANPFAVKSVSLQLSFAAMLGLILLSPRLYERIGGDRRRWAARFVCGSLAATAGALVFTVPLTALYFDILVLVAPVSNLLCLWAATLTFALGLLTALLGMVFPAAAQLAAYVPHWGALYLLTVARWLSGIPYHAVYFSNSYLKVWLAYVYAMFLVCVVAGKGRLRYAMASVLAALTLALVLWLNAAPMRSGALHVVALDVGQGQCVALVSQGSAALIDCGSKSYLDAGTTAADYLRGAGILSLDYVVLSHYHADHCNGLGPLLARVKVKRLLAPDVEPDDAVRGEVLALAKQYGVAVEFVDEKTTLPLGSASLTVYPPVAEGDMNEECLAALCTAGSFDALFTGDMDANTEYLLAAHYDLPDVEVLMAGHHGSRWSTGDDLLAEVRPETAIVSCGADNRYGHPHAEALLRLYRAGAAVYRTDLQGTIHITVR